MGPTIVFILIALAVAIGVLVATARPHLRRQDHHVREQRPRNHTSRTGR